MSGVLDGWSLISLTGVAAIVTVFLAGTVQGSTGFGFNMLAAPVLAVLDPAFVPGPMLVMASAVCVGGALAERQNVNRSDLGFALAGRLIAAAAAALVVGLLSPQAFSGLFGLAVLLAVALSLAGWKIVTRPSTLFGAGLVSGFMGTLTSIGAPPMAIVYQNAEPARMRATLNAYFLFGGLISIAALLLAGRFGWRDLALGGAMMPFALAGFLASGWGRRLMDRGRVKPVVIAVSLASAVVLLFRAFT
ncbi:TSUP family transporter [Pseudogemmobacter sonorensis]|uniref:TSUP family transporter n=1 Tax=Pseudogemmobacter sonorensis TaxID=2989681 RepID=UPI003674D702